MNEPTKYMGLSSIDEVSSFDELPLWSAPFGIKLLEKVEYRTNIKAIDIGCGTGFPLIELAQRFGQDSHFIGLDNWEPALDRINLKLKVYGIKNVTTLKADALEIPFPNEHFDLVVSNNGINNLSSIEKALIEVYRISQPNAQFVMTVNLPDTFKEFYNVYRAILAKNNLFKEIVLIDEDIKSKRKSEDELHRLLLAAGFKIKSSIIDSFTMKFSNAQAFMEHYFIKIAFKEHWFDFLNGESKDMIYYEVISELNKIADNNEGLNLTVPFICIDSRKT